MSTVDARSSCRGCGKPVTFPATWCGIKCHDRRKAEFLKRKDRGS